MKAEQREGGLALFTWCSHQYLLHSMLQQSMHPPTLNSLLDGPASASLAAPPAW